MWAVQFGPDNRVASASGDETVKLWNAATGLCLLTLTGHKGAVQHLRFSPRLTLLASCGIDGKVCIWSAKTGQLQLALSMHHFYLGDLIHDLEGHHEHVTCCSFNGDHQLATGSADATVRIWNLSSGKCSATIQDHDKDISNVEEPHFW